MQALSQDPTCHTRCTVCPLSLLSANSPPLVSLPHPVPALFPGHGPPTSVTGVRASPA